MIKAIFFDFDGVLTNHLFGSYTFCKNLSEKTGIDFEKLKADYRPFEKKLKLSPIKHEEIWDEFTSEEHPHDHLIFTKLVEKGRRLAVSIPGVACHVDLTFSGVVCHMSIEPWAIELMCDHLEKEMADIVQANPFRAGEYADLKKSLVINRTGQEKLMVLDAMRQVFKK